MLEGLINLAWAGVYSGGAFGDLLYQWEQMGMFAYILPFLLIFAIVYGVLDRTKIFGGKGTDGKDIGATSVNAIIAIVVGLMALQFQMVSVFFAEIFPRMGVGLSIILVVLILVGMFIPKESSFSVYSMLTLSVVIGVIVIGKSFGWVGWVDSSGWWSQNSAAVVGVIFILIVLGIAFFPKSGAKPKSIFSSIIDSAGN